MTVITGQVTIDIHLRGAFTRTLLPVLLGAAIALGLFLPLPLLVGIPVLVEILSVLQEGVPTPKLMFLRGSLMLGIYPRLTTGIGFLPHHLLIKRGAVEGNVAKIIQWMIVWLTPVPKKLTNCPPKETLMQEVTTTTGSVLTHHLTIRAAASQHQVRYHHPSHFPPLSPPRICGTLRVSTASDIT